MYACIAFILVVGRDFRGGTSRTEAWSGASSLLCLCQCVDSNLWLLRYALINIMVACKKCSSCLALVVVVLLQCIHAFFFNAKYLELFLQAFCLYRFNFPWNYFSLQLLALFGGVHLNVKFRYFSLHNQYALTEDGPIISIQCIHLLKKNLARIINKVVVVTHVCMYACLFPKCL